MQQFAETERLILREIVDTDAAHFFELDSDPMVQAFVGNKPITSISEAKKTIEYVRQQYKTNGIGRWAVIEKKTGDFLGWAGLKKITDEEINGFKDHYDLGYRLLRTHWGKGFATEAAIASRDYGFNVLNQEILFAFADERNAASRQVLKKTGFNECGIFDYHGRPHCWLQAKQITNPL